MTAVQERKPYAYGRDHEFTKEEYDALMKEYFSAVDRDDQETAMKLLRRIPQDADVMMAFGSTYGRNFVLEGGFDVTQANMKFGEGWLDELKA
jgi:hypothetical protein